MLDEDLAEMYKVETKRLNEQVKRNSNRFPKDFMFTLTGKEFTNLKSQNATSSWGGRRKLPNAFTEQGVAFYLGNDKLQCRYYRVGKNYPPDKLFRSLSFNNQQI